MEIEFNKLDTSDLIVGRIYKGGSVSNRSAEPFHKLIPGCENAGIFCYYGDNRKPERELTDTEKKGNLILETTFALLNEGVHLQDIPPFLKFKKTGNGRDIQFLGLAAPGNPMISPDKDLGAFWRAI